MQYDGQIFTGDQVTVERAVGVKILEVINAFVKHINITYKSMNSYIQCKHYIHRTVLKTRII